MASDVRLEEGEEVKTFEGEKVKAGMLPGVLIGETRVWRNGKEMITEVEGLFPDGLTSTLDSSSLSRESDNASWRVSAWRLVSSFTMSFVGLGAKILLRGLNTTVVHGGENLEKALKERGSDTALLTVINHQSCLDDPGIWGAILPPRILADTRIMRWGASASEVIFVNRPLATFWSLGKVVPIVRGWGVYQPAMNFLQSRLDAGGWVNVFPEGKVNWPREDMRLRWGVGRLVADCQAEKLMVMPVYHHGMADVLPNPVSKGERQPVVPRPGNLVTVCIGQPINLAPLLARMRRSGMEETEVRSRLTKEVQSALEELGREARMQHKNDFEKWLWRWHYNTDVIPSILT